MSYEGDLHNFGQRVQPVERASGSYFQKPRPVYWEWLFFGRTSPLVPFFSKVGAGPRSPAAYLFNLDVEMSAGSLSGFSRRVLSSEAGQLNPGHAYSLGVLLAYCYIFGIRDLHRHNLIRTETHLQVVDAEVVLVRLLLPNETLLLPFKEVGPGLAAISHLGPDPAVLSAPTLSLILTGYCDTFHALADNLSDIQQVFAELKPEMARNPVRHILRDTIQYRNASLATPQTPFFDAELKQLTRGDIPYFFKFIGDPGLYQYSDSEGSSEAVMAPPAFTKAIERDAVDPAVLLTRHRIEEALFPTGLLFLGKHLLGPGGLSQFKLDGIHLALGMASVELKLSGRSYRAPLPVE